MDDYRGIIRTIEEIKLMMSGLPEAEHLSLSGTAAALSQLSQSNIKNMLDMIANYSTSMRMLQSVLPQDYPGDLNSIVGVIRSIQDSFSKEMFGDSLDSILDGTDGGSSVVLPYKSEKEIINSIADKVEAEIPKDPSLIAEGKLSSICAIVSLVIAFISLVIDFCNTWGNDSSSLVVNTHINIEIPSVDDVLDELEERGYIFDYDEDIPDPTLGNESKQI